MKPRIPRQRGRRTAASLAAALALVIGTGLILTGGPAEAGTADAAATVSTAPVMDCAAIAKLDLNGISGAPTQIASATVLAAGDNTSGTGPRAR